MGNKHTHHTVHINDVNGCHEITIQPNSKHFIEFNITSIVSNLLHTSQQQNLHCYIQCSLSIQYGVLNKLYMCKKQYTPDPNSRAIWPIDTVNEHMIDLNAQHTTQYNAQHTHGSLTNKHDTIIRPNNNTINNNPQQLNDIRYNNITIDPIRKQIILRIFSRTSNNFECSPYIITAVTSKQSACRFTISINTCMDDMNGQNIVNNQVTVNNIRPVSSMGTAYISTPNTTSMDVQSQLYSQQLLIQQLQQSIQQLTNQSSSNKSMNELLLDHTKSRRIIKQLTLNLQHKNALIADLRAQLRGDLPCTDTMTLHAADAVLSGKNGLKSIKHSVTQPNTAREIARHDHVDGSHTARDLCNPPIQSSDNHSMTQPIPIHQSTGNTQQIDNKHNAHANRIDVSQSVDMITQSINVHNVADRSGSKHPHTIDALHTYIPNDGGVSSISQPVPDVPHLKQSDTDNQSTANKPNNDNTVHRQTAKPSTPYDLEHQQQYIIDIKSHEQPLNIPVGHKLSNSIHDKSNVMLAGSNDRPHHKQIPTAAVHLESNPFDQLDRQYNKLHDDQSLSHGNDTFNHTQPFDVVSNVNDNSMVDDNITVNKQHTDSSSNTIDSQANKHVPHKHNADYHNVTHPTDRHTYSKQQSTVPLTKQHKLQPLPTSTSNKTLTPIESVKHKSIRIADQHNDDIERPDDIDDAF